MSWHPRFFEASSLFSPIRDVAARFQDDDAFPSPERIDEVLRDLAPVRFVRARQDDKRLYDASIVEAREVRTRAGSWHDLLNALVWAVFPVAKAALHARQHRIVVPGAPRRTPEGDALALVDEGGVLVTPRGAYVFGHAIYESLVLERPLTHGAALVLGDEATPTPLELDRAAASAIADTHRLLSTKDLPRHDLVTK